MRIRDKTFLLCLEIQCEDGVTVFFRDCSGHDLPTTREKHHDTDRFTVEITLPSKIIVHIDTMTEISVACPLAELKKIMFIGLPVSKENLLPHAIYHAASNHDKSLTLDQIESLPAQKTLSWQSGYVIINFFHSDPFAWHLLIGNKIPFRI